jgi:tripartite-type tricarboxylate transporter receptor subunit TctC
MNRRLLVKVFFLSCISLLSIVPSAHSQTSYPSKPVKIIVPFGAGGTGDILARIFGQYLEGQTKQSVFIENKPGASGILGTEAAKNAEPDGYTLLLSTNTTHAANVSLFKKLPYDPVKDFVNIASFGYVSMVGTIPPDSPFNSISSLVTYSNNNPGKVFYGFYNSASLMSAEQLKSRSGANLTGVSYKTIGNAITDLMGGQIQLLFLETASGSSFVEGKKILPIGVTSLQRYKKWPHVPAIAETYPGFELTAYLALSAPAKTPPDIVNALNQWANKSLSDPIVKTKFDNLGIYSQTMTLEEMKKYVQSEIDRWMTYTKNAGIEPQ